MRRRPPGLCLWLVCVMAACARPATPTAQPTALPAARQAAATPSAGAQAPAPSAPTAGVPVGVAAPGVPAPGKPDLRRLKPRTGGRLPPQVLATPQPLDRSCDSDADCAVKDVGTCCGAAPACVNRNSPTDPAAVRAQCQRAGRSSVCGFAQITACACRRGQCVPDAQVPVGGWIDDPAPPPDPVR